MASGLNVLVEHRSDDRIRTYRFGFLALFLPMGNGR